MSEDKLNPAAEPETLRSEVVYSAGARGIADVYEWCMRGGAMGGYVRLSERDEHGLAVFAGVRRGEWHSLSLSPGADGPLVAVSYSETQHAWGRMWLPEDVHQWRKW